MAKLIIVEGNSNDKDNVRVLFAKGEKGDKGDSGGVWGAISGKISEQDDLQEEFSNLTKSSLQLGTPSGTITGTGVVLQAGEVTAVGHADMQSDAITDIILTGGDAYATGNVFCNKIILSSNNTLYITFKNTSNSEIKFDFSIRFWNPQN